VTIEERKLATKEAQAAVDDLQLRIDQLRTKRVDLDAKIDEVAKDSKNGRVPGLTELSPLSLERSQVESEFSTATGELNAARATLARAQEAYRVARFRDVIARIEQARDAVVEHARQASLQFGTFYALQKEATGLANAANGGAGCLPHERTTLAEVCKTINPYAGRWMESKKYVAVDFELCFRLQPLAEL
jgi:hypothetical protein